MARVDRESAPAWTRSPTFMIGQDRRGNWVVEDQAGARGGLFVSLQAALRFVRSENGNKRNGYVIAAELWDLNISGTSG